MLYNRIHLKSALLIAGLLLLFACTTGELTADQASMDSADQYGTPQTAGVLSGSCPADRRWINQPSLPTEVAGEQSNCNFHQFMWQSLLYLVQPTTADAGVREFETWMPSYGIFVGNNERPAPWGTVPQPTYCQGTSAAKANHIFSDLTEQAGSNHPLIDKASNRVFYNISVNRPAYEFITGCDLYKAQCALTLAPDLLTPTAMTVVDIPAKYPDLAFPDQSIELKTSWKILTPEEQSGGTFYTTTGSVKSPGKDCLEHVVLGLVGIHIVSKTASHPEFIWATFEHKNNAPDCNKLDAEPPLEGGWTFYDADCKENCTTNQYSPGKAAQVCRMHPWGDPTVGTFPNDLNCKSTPPPEYICDPDTQKYIINPNTANLKALNRSVDKMLRALPATDNNRLWANYQLVGNVWTARGSLPPDLRVQRGSLSDANTTMETYVQNGTAGVTNPNNCFSCHNLDGQSLIAPPGQPSHPVKLPPVGVSHIFNLLNRNTRGCDDGSALPASCPINQR